MTPPNTPHDAPAGVMSDAFLRAVTAEVVKVARRNRTGSGEQAVWWSGPEKKYGFTVTCGETATVGRAVMVCASGPVGNDMWIESYRQMPSNNDLRRRIEDAMRMLRARVTGQFAPTPETVS